MHKKLLCVLFAFLCFGHKSVFAAEYTCPEFIDISESTEEAGADWSVINGRKNTVFSNSALSDGHPDQQVFLRPRAEKEELVGKLLVKKWIYDISDREGSAFYLTCYYKNSKVTLTKALSESLRVCEQVDGKLIRNISCY